MTANHAVDVAVATVLPAEHTPQAGALHGRDPDARECGGEGLESREHRGCPWVACGAWWRQRDRRDARIHLGRARNQLARSRQRRDPLGPPACTRSARSHPRRNVPDWLATERDRSDHLGHHVQLVLPPRVEPRRVAREGAVAG